MQELVLIVASNVYGRILQTLFVHFIRNRIVNTDCVGFRGHCGTTMAHVVILTQVNTGVY